MRLLLLRHGQPARDGAADHGGPSLTALGHRQAALLAEQMVFEKPDILITSPLSRAIETAKPTAIRLRMTPIQEQRISEIDGDGFAYVHIEDLRAVGGETWREFLRDPIRVMGGDGDRFRARVLEGFEYIFEHFRDAQTVAVFAHGFPINLLIGHVLGIDCLTKFQLAHGSITRISGRSLNRLSVISINETGHFPPEGL